MPLERQLSRRTWLRSSAGLGLLVAGTQWPRQALAAGRDLRIKKLVVTPVALPDPPLLAASGCHGPYFLRTILQLEIEGGFVGIGETYGTLSVLQQLEKARAQVEGQSAFAVRRLATDLAGLDPSVYAGIEMACLDAVGQATGRRVCELLGGPVRENVEFAAYLFYRYASDDARVLSDERLVDARGRGDKALDQWGEVRSAEAMVELAAGFRQQFGFRVLKLKGGVLSPEEELKTLKLWRERFGDDVLQRIDPNGNWTLETALSVGRQIRQANLPLEYYEDPVIGQSAMGDVRIQTGLKLATNMCVTRWNHIEPATRTRPIDVLLADIYWFGGLTGCQALGRAATSLGWGLGCHSNSHAGVTMAALIHLGACVPELTYALDTHYPWLAERADILQGPKLTIKDGRMEIPAEPGLGVKLDPDKLARAHEVYRRSGMTGRDDATTMQRFQPGWKRTAN